MKFIKNHLMLILPLMAILLGIEFFLVFDRTTNTYEKSLHFFESTDPMDITSRVSKLDLTQTHFIIISKSFILIVWNPVSII